MMALDIFGKGELHEYYPLLEPLLVNNQWFNVIDIWQHYKEKHPYITDKIILEFVKQLHSNNYPVYRLGYLKTNDGKMWRTYYYDKFYINNKAYRLAWLINEGSDILHILHCLRRNQYDKK